MTESEVGTGIGSHQGTPPTASPAGGQHGSSSAGPGGERAASGGRNVVRLVGANIPADQGLSSLGLIMQLGGSLSAAVITFWGFQALLLPSRAGTTMLVLLVTTLGVIRSLMHRAAGTSLLYAEANPLRGVRRYIAVGLVHSALFAAVLVSQHVATTRMSIFIGLALAAWPLILLGLLRLPWLRRFEDAVPAPEDKGFEGAAVLMTVMAIAGIAAGLFMLRGFASRDALRGTNVLMLLCVVLLLARSVMHLVAGLTGLRAVALDVAVERVAQYANVGVVSAFVTGGVLFITVMSSAALGFAGLLVIAVAVWMLCAWPMSLRRFFAERQFASMLAGDDAPIHRRAPDAGSTALGWLLIGIGALTLSVSIAAAGGGFGDGGSRYDDGSVLTMLQPLMMGGSWRTFAIAALELVAGFELVRMAQHHRIVATVAAIAIAGIELSSWGPGWSTLSQIRVGFYNTSALTTLLGPLGLALTTIVLVNRKVESAGHAQVRVRAKA